MANRVQWRTQANAPSSVSYMQTAHLPHTGARNTTTATFSAPINAETLSGRLRKHTEGYPGSVSNKVAHAARVRACVRVRLSLPPSPYFSVTGDISCPELFAAE